jgi:hypothetical protein
MTNFLLDWSKTAVFPTSPSLVAGIAGVSHDAQPVLSVYKQPGFKWFCLTYYTHGPE